MKTEDARLEEIPGRFLPENPTQFGYLHAIRAVLSRAGACSAGGVMRQVFDLADAGMNLIPEASAGCQVSSDQVETPRTAAGGREGGGAMSGAVESFARGLWQLREEGRLDRRTALSQGRLLYVAAVRDVEDRPGYDPEADLRLDWARQVLAAAREGCARPLGDSGAEEAMEMMLRTGGWTGFAATGGDGKL